MRHTWRLQSDDHGLFDELVVTVGRKPKAGVSESGTMLHAEMMDARSMFVDVAGVCLWVRVDNKGIARITMSEDRRADVIREINLRDPALDKPRRKR